MTLLNQHNRDESVKRIVIYVNLYLSVIGGMILFLFSGMLDIGPDEDYAQPDETWFTSFVERLIPIIIIGLIGVAGLTTMNIILNVTIMRDKPKVGLWRMSLINMAIVFSLTLLGSIIFFSR